MEHLLIYVVHFILWLDRKSQRPVRKVVPNLDELLEQPKVALSRGEIVVGPFQRWASGLALGSVVALILAGLWHFCFREMIGKPAGPLLPGEKGFFLLVLLVIIVGSLWLMLRWLRGGYLILRIDGIELRHRRTAVRCPWSLFNATGNPFLPAKDRILLPVDPAAVPYVEAHQEERLLGKGTAVKTKPLQFKSSSLAMLRSIYCAKINGIGLLLLRLGQKLGSDLPDEMLIPTEMPPEQESKPLVVRKPNGWISATLTHLSLPPYCCDCGVATRATKDHQAQSFLGEAATLEVPICGQCQRRHERTQRRAIGRAILVGVTLGIFVAVGLAVLAQNAMLVFLTAIPFGLMGLTLGAIIGARNGRREGQPVRLRAYSPSTGTISLWFRNPAYGDALMEVMQGVEDMAVRRYRSEEERPALRW